MLYLIFKRDRVGYGIDNYYIYFEITKETRHSNYINQLRLLILINLDYLY